MCRMISAVSISCLFAMAHTVSLCPFDHGIPGFSTSEEGQCLSMVPIQMAPVPWNLDWHRTADQMCSYLFDSGKLARLARLSFWPPSFGNVAETTGRFVVADGCASKRGLPKKRRTIDNASFLHLYNNSYSGCSEGTVREWRLNPGSTRNHWKNIPSSGKVRIGFRNLHDEPLVTCAYFDLGNLQEIPKYFSCTNRSFPVDYVLCEHPSLETVCAEWDMQGKKCSRCAAGRRGPFCAIYYATRKQRNGRSMTDVIFARPDCSGFCPPNALCVPEHPGSAATTYRCQCHWAYNGEDCKNKWSRCHLSQFCGPHSWCKDVIFKLDSGYKYSYSCICDAGWTGANCMIEINECLSEPCHNGGSCVDRINSFACICDSAYTGRLCEKDLNECLDNPCTNGRCANEFGSFSCECYPGYIGKTCEIDINECESNPCIHGTCYDLPNSYFCVCTDGYTGHRCSTPIDQCSSHPCKNGGTCISKDDGFTCQCLPDVRGKFCEGARSICSYRPCQLGGTCKPTAEGFECQCRPGHSGKSCEKSVNECLPRPCKNGGYCVDGDGTYTCTCMVGFQGVNCEIDIDECLSNPCGPTALCINLQGSYECECDEGYDGEECENVKDLCIPNPCRNGGTCTKKFNAFSCRCTEEYTGELCGTAVIGCSQNPCMFGKCEYKEDNAVCKCDQGFTGKRCDMRINFCEGVICSRNARCISSLHGYHCECNPGFTGRNCETNYVGACKYPEICANGGTCQAKGVTFECRCPPGFSGETCEIQLPGKKSDEEEKEGLPKSSLILLSVLGTLAMCPIGAAAWLIMKKRKSNKELSISLTGRSYSSSRHTSRETKRGGRTKPRRSSSFRVFFSGPERFSRSRKCPQTKEKGVKQIQLQPLM